MGCNGPPLSHRLYNKSPSTRHRNPLFELLVRGVQEILQRIQAPAMAFCCLLELEDKTQLLKTTHAWDTGLRGLDLELTEGPIV